MPWPSVKLCWLLTTFQSDAASAHWRSSLVSDKHVSACRFQSVSPGAAVHWFGFHAARDESEWCILLWHLAAQTVAARHLSSCWRLLLSSTSRVCKSTELMRHKTRDFTPDVASQQTRPQFCILQTIESHSGKRLLEGCQTLLMSCGY